MKTGIFILTTLIVFACNNKSKTNGTPVDMINNPSTANNPTAEPSEHPVMTFEKMEHNFGDIMEGASVETTFKFKNTGKADLLIDRCDVSCGCTVPSFPRQPIKPGEEGEIKVQFNSSGKSGKNNKNVTVISNVKEKQVVLKFEANVFTVNKQQ